MNQNVSNVVWCVLCCGNWHGNRFLTRSWQDFNTRLKSISNLTIISTNTRPLIDCGKIWREENCLKNSATGRTPTSKLTFLFSKRSELKYYLKIIVLNTYVEVGISFFPNSNCYLVFHMTKDQTIDVIVWNFHSLISKYNESGGHIDFPNQNCHLVFHRTKDQTTDGSGGCYSLKVSQAALKVLQVSILPLILSHPYNFPAVSNPQSSLFSSFFFVVFCFFFCAQWEIHLKGNQPFLIHNPLYFPLFSL